MQLNDLLGQPPARLDALFGAAAPGPIPVGDSLGEAIVWPGTFWSRIVAHFVHDLAWQGKIFTPNPAGADGATLRNKVTALGVDAIIAQVYYDASWFDGKPSIALDYSKTSLLARKIRDEIRLIDPAAGIYLGKVWWGKTALIGFALKFKPHSSADVP